MKAIKLISKFFIFIILTIVTQVGGIAYLLANLTYKLTDKFATNKLLKSTYRLGSFLIIYSLVCFIIVPTIARKFDRVPLPLTVTNYVRPLNKLTYLLNRNYVKASLKQTTFEVANQINRKYPGTVINYLDANFPFFDNFPLVPHLSHDDGKKLDLSFFYKDASTGASTNNCPAFIGYGICEEPTLNEINTSDLCAEKGYWQYSFLKKITPQSNKEMFVLDDEKTKTLVNLFVSQKAIGKVFIEPHLKNRLGLTSSKVRFHGCQAVRHDDHIHLQLK